MDFRRALVTSLIGLWSLNSVAAPIDLRLDFGALAPGVGGNWNEINYSDFNASEANAIDLIDFNTGVSSGITLRSFTPAGPVTIGTDWNGGANKDWAAAAAVQDFLVTDGVPLFAIEGLDLDKTYRVEWIAADDWNVTHAAVHVLSSSSFTRPTRTYNGGVGDDPDFINLLHDGMDEANWVIFDGLVPGLHQWGGIGVAENALTFSGDTEIGSQAIINAFRILEEETTPQPGTTPDNPLVPDPDPTTGGWDFIDVDVEPGQWTFFDPLVAIGYDYIVDAGPDIAGVTLPEVGDDLFELYLWNGIDWILQTDTLTANTEYMFGAGGVDRFRILGIETDALLDPNDPFAFVTGLDFVSAGTVSLSQDPITAFVSAPATPLLFAVAGLSLAGLRRHRRRR